MSTEYPHRYVPREEGKPVTVKKFHVYKDCGQLQSEAPKRRSDGEPMMIGVPTPPSVEVYPATVHVDLDDTMVDLMGLTVCQQCDRRFHRKSAERIIEEYIEAVLKSAYPHEARASELIDALAAGGYVLKDAKAR